MIFAQDLTKQFADFVAVDGIDLDVQGGQILAILGPNGAGKTTTVRMLTSVLRPTRGTAKVAGFDVVEEPGRVRASVGVLTEHHGLYGRMNADEYLAFYADLYRIPPPAALQRMDILLAQFGLAEVRRKKLGEYSKGMRQKLALVRALIHNPPVLLLDEPTSAMDPESARVVRDAIRGLRSDRRTIVLCTHNLSEAEQLADQIVIIRRGKILLSGSPQVIKQQLLGPEEFEAKLAYPVDGRSIKLPPGVCLMSNGGDKLVFQVEDPLANNPGLISGLIEAGHRVVSFSAVPRSLEDAYMQAVSQNDRVETHAE